MKVCRLYPPFADWFVFLLQIPIVPLTKCNLIGIVLQAGKLEVTIDEPESFTEPSGDPFSVAHASSIVIGTCNAHMCVISGHRGTSDTLLSMRVRNLCMDECVSILNLRLPIIRRLAGLYESDLDAFEMGIEINVDAKNKHQKMTLAVDFHSIILHHRSYQSGKHWGARLGDFFDVIYPIYEGLDMTCAKTSRINAHLHNSYIQYTPVRLHSIMMLQLDEFDFTTVVKDQ
jgi:hypothetical protein